jgi:RNA polymerase sigma factor (sigma-70 family)
MALSAATQPERTNRTAPRPEQPGESVAERFRDGDEAALGEVVENMGPRLKAFCRTITRSAEIAEEVVQEVFATAWSSRSQLRDPKRLESWLFKAARRAAVRQATKLSSKMERAVEDDVLASFPLASDAPDARRGLLAEQSARLLEEALASLDPKRRDLLAMRYFSEMQLAEIAEALDMPLGSVGTTIARALESLRRRFESMGLRQEDLLP